VLELGVEVPVRDGAVLRGLRWRAGRSPAPTVLVMTPYGADRYHADGRRFAALGFHLVALDVRGRGDSDGRFRPFERDGQDGHDAVEWLAGRPWSGGDVAVRR
jgi:putative CocE/NonD family hydrolase